MPLMDQITSAATSNRSQVDQPHGYQTYNIVYQTISTKKVETSLFGSVHKVIQNMMVLSVYFVTGSYAQNPTDLLHTNLSPVVTFTKMKH